MICQKCGINLPDEASYCWKCGRKLRRQAQAKKRGNGQGTVIQLESGKYKAIVTVGYYTDDSGKRHRKTRSKVFDRKKDAIASITELQASPKVEAKKALTFKAVYDLWLPTHKAGKSTVACYTAAMKYFEPLYFSQISEIDIDDLQECIDDCPHGRRTKENMKAVCGLMYKYAIPRHLVQDNMNLAQFLSVTGDGAAQRASFTDLQIEAIKKACGIVPHANEIYVMIYTGFRPSEFLGLTASDYDISRLCLVGGSKTQAGRGRCVTISPKIKSHVEALVASGGPLCKDQDGKPWLSLKQFTENAFYPALEAIGVENPIVEVGGGKKRHKYTPHTCRHTFATLMKRVEGSDKDKQALIGHASSEMLRYYQDSTLDDIRRITDKL